MAVILLILASRPARSERNFRAAVQHDSSEDKKRKMYKIKSKSLILL